MVTKNVYSAGGFFNDGQNELLEKVGEKLKQNPTVGEVYLPEMHQAVGEFGSLEWKLQTFNADIVAIQNSDVVVAAITDDSPDSGTIWEIGYAIGIGKPVVLYTDSDKTNLMLAMSIQLFIPENKDVVNNAIDLETVDFNAMPTNLWVGEVE